MKRAITLAMSLLISNALAATPTATQPESQKWQTNQAEATAPKPMPASANPKNPTPPLNEYGAVDVNAHVPVSEQVPAAPSDFTPPDIRSEAEIWSDLVPTQPVLNAKSYVLMDANSGHILAAYNANERVAPASLTKLMLLYIAESELKNGRIKMTDMVTVPRVAWATGGSRMFLRPGMKVTVASLIQGIVVDSGNDAAVTLSTYIAGTQTAFVSMMNHAAQKLGMTNTHFTDVMGLPAPYHYSSARDMAVLAHAIVTEFPQYLGWYKQKSFTFNGIKQANFNKLLFIYEYADGLKTGSTDAAGYSLVSTAKMPNNPMRLIGVVMGAPSPMNSATESKALLTYGFHFFKTQLMYSKGQKIKIVRVAMSKNKTMPVGVAEDLYVTVPNSNDAKITADLVVNEDLKAPITKGQDVGKVIVKLQDKVVAQVPAVALEAAEKGGWWRRTADTVSSWF